MCQECMYAALAAAATGATIFKNRRAIMSSIKVKLGTNNFIKCKDKRVLITRGSL